MTGLDPNSKDLKAAAGEIAAMPAAVVIDAPLKGAEVHSEKKMKLLNATVVIAALGYFVDMFDITLYGVVRIPSLNGIGLTDPNQILQASVFLGNMGMIGMLLGGIVWGIMGDKVGRLSILFGSILLYSLGNIGNAFVTTVPQYAVMRFISGFGLAGELGAAVTLVSEVMPKESRGWATTIIATLGLLGSVAASVFGQLLDWKVAYILGGSMGLLLLVARFHTFESGMFDQVKHSSVKRGDVFMLFSPKRLPRYLYCIFLGAPIYFTTGLLLTYAPELTTELGFKTPVTAGNALLFGTIGLTVGDLVSGVTSQLLKSRKKALGIFLAGVTVLCFVYSLSASFPVEVFYALCFCLGLCAGYWAVFVTVAAEQFGTNLRATVSTTVPNFVRASAVIFTLGFASLKPYMSIMTSALLIGGLCFSLAFFALWRLPETFGKDLDYLE